MTKEETKSYLLTLPKGLHTSLKKLSAETGKSMNELIVEILDEHIWADSNIF